MHDTAEQAVVILGIGHRCGTNFLSDLLVQHADTCRPTHVPEDFFVHHAQHLQTFAAGLHASWGEGRRLETPQEEIGATLGQGLLALLRKQTDRQAPYLVTKTPRADHVQLCPWLFPDQRLILLIRDGRSVVESAVKSFHWSYRKAIDRWRRGARRILEFDRDHCGGSYPYLVVRYEDLVTNLEAELHRLLGFLGLDPRRYDFDAAAALPVRGSSTLKLHGEPLHWRPVAKRSDFSPLDRAAGWSLRQQARFLWRAGAYQRLLGYSAEAPQADGLLGSLFQRLLDLQWQRHTARHNLQPLGRQIFGLQLADSADEPAVVSLPQPASRRAA
ncbi:MAG: sulfotransferase [Pirellulaceae bacterium]